jgi:hypothetical protein
MGPKDNLRQAVEMHLLDSVSQAATLAVVQEHLCGRFKSQQRKPTFTKTDTKSTVSSTALWKARQLKE